MERLEIRGPQAEKHQQQRQQQEQPQQSNNSGLEELTASIRALGDEVRGLRAELATANSRAVALFTPASVACADSTTATSRVNAS